MAISLDEFMKLTPEPLPMLIGRGILPATGKIVIAGQPKANKSFVAINAMVALAKGTNAFNATYKSGSPVFPVHKKCRVLYLEQELGFDGLQTRLAKLLDGQDLSEIELFIKTRDTAMRLDTPDGEEYILGEIEEVKPNVVVMDPLAKFNLADENSAQEMGFVMRVSDHIVEKYHCAVCFVHHLKKPNEQNPARGGDRLRGSSAIFADVDTLWEVERMSNESTKEPILKFSFELRRGEPLEPMYFKRLLSGEVVYMGEEFTWGGSERGYRPKNRYAKY